ncbi:MAG: hypothetical protein H8Z69_01510 [Nanohaloarchaea archaeon]|nr:hypothetical protein [Candidatus Nanohaloarchaea archaeon]
MSSEVYPDWEIVPGFKEESGKEGSKTVTLRLYDESDRDDHHQDLLDFQKDIVELDIASKTDVYTAAIARQTGVSSVVSQYIRDVMSDASQVQSNVDGEDLSRNFMKAFSVVRELDYWSKAYEGMTGKSYLSRSVDDFLEDYNNQEFLESVEENEDHLEEYAKDLRDLVHQAEDVNRVLFNGNWDDRVKQDVERMQMELEDFKNPYLLGLRMKTGV